MRLTGHPRLARASLWLSLPMVVLGLLLSQLAICEENQIFAGRYADESALLNWLWSHSPEVLAARADAEIAMGAVTQAQLQQNPQIDATWGTIPIGRTTPAGLNNPLGQVSNVGLALGQTFEPGKRGPRKIFAQSGVAVARAQAADVAVGRFFDLLVVIGRVALVQVRQACFDALVVSSSELLELQKVRAGRGDVAELDVTRAEVEHQRVLAQRSGLDRDLADALADCSMITAALCAPFADAAAARAWLDGQRAVGLPAQWSETVAQRRTDIQVLVAQSEQAHALTQVARAKGLPDVSAHLGYLWDNFVISGNQQQSLAIGVGMTLPIFDFGQADAWAGKAGSLRAVQVQFAVQSAAKQVLMGALRRIATARAREESLDHAIEKAAKVVKMMGDMHRRGAVSLTELILARQAWRALLLERLDLDVADFQAVMDARRAGAVRPPLPTP